MKKCIWIFMFCLPIIVMAQIRSDNNGIVFSNELNWKQVLKKAREEGKYIFLDCYATWCAPCKVMEAQVFSKPEISDLFNKRFISIRLQMDKTNSDSKQVQDWYRTGIEISKEYGVPAYPTSLFFSPSGVLVDRRSGYLDPNDFLSLGKSVVSGERGSYLTYYKMLAKYKRGEKDFNELGPLADTAKLLSQKDIAAIVSSEYRGFLLNNPSSTWLREQNLNFISNFITGSKDPFFSFLYQSSDKVDSVMNKVGFAENVINKVILKEDINPVTKPIVGAREVNAEAPKSDGEPDWQALQQRIGQKYTTNYAERNIMFARIQWYDDHQEWGACGKYFTLFVDKFFPKYIDNDFAGFINNESWGAVFKRSVQKDQIDAAIKIMSALCRQYGYAANLDTYANLLYKAGRVEEAIQTEELAISSTQLPQRYSLTVDKMKKGKPTWGHYVARNEFGVGLID